METIKINRMKILIQVSGGVVNNIMADEDIDIILIDWDNIGQGDKLEDISSPDIIIDKFHKFYEDYDSDDEEQVYNFLLKNDL